MSSENSPPPSPDATRRRSSFSPGQAFSGLFSRPSNAGQPPPPTNAFPGPIATAAANAQQRRSMSITTLGLSTSSPTQASSFGKPPLRRGSISSSGSGSPQVDEEAIDDDTAAPQSTPATPFGRRLSFGAQALRDVRVGSGGTNVGEGLNWGEQLRARARAPSFGSGSSNQPTERPLPPIQKVPGMEIKDPPPPPRRAAPDHIGEKMLRGDFYMD